MPTRWAASKGVTPGSEDAFSRGTPEACPCLMQVAVEAGVPKERPVSEDRWTKEAATICPLPGGLLRKACNVRRSRSWLPAGFTSSL
jgi:hypothetical protein